MTQEFVLAKIKALGQDVEEELTLDVDGFTLVGFATNRPAVKVGDIRKVQLKLFTTSDYCLTSVSGDEAPSMNRIGTGFGYRIVGTLIDQGVSLGAMTLLDESLATDYADLVGEPVSLTAERIGVRFVRE